MSFCPKCGAQLEDGMEECPNCKAPIRPKKKKLQIEPLTAVHVLFSCVALIFGFIITTSALANKRGIGYVEYIAIIPALTSLAIATYQLFDTKNSKSTKQFSIISLCVSGFILFYAFIAFMVFIG